MKRAVGISILLTGTAVCLSAGYRQLQKKLMTKDLVSKRTNKLSQPPVKVDQNPFPWTSNDEDWDFKPILVEGKFDHSKEMLILRKYRERDGYQVLTPLTLADGRTLIVGRGWIPLELKASIKPSLAKEAVCGILRPSVPQDSFLPQNNSVLNEWFYEDLPQMALYANAVNLDEASKYYLQAVAFDRQPHNGEDLPEIPLRPTKSELLSSTCSLRPTWRTLTSGASQSGSALAESSQQSEAGTA